MSPPDVPLIPSLTLASGTPLGCHGALHGNPSPKRVLHSTVAGALRPENSLETRVGLVGGRVISKHKWL